MRMKRIFLTVTVLMAAVLGLRAGNFFNRYNLVSPLALASGGIVAMTPSDSYNFYASPSLLGITDYSYFEASYAADSFKNGFFGLSLATEKKGLSPYNFACKFYYNDCSDEVISSRSYGVNPGLSVRLQERLWAGLSLLLGKDSLAGMNNLFFVSSFSVTARVMEKSLSGIFIRGLGKDLTDFGRYSGPRDPDAGFVFHQAFSFPLEAQLALDYSAYSGLESSVSFLYLIKPGAMEIAPLAGLCFGRDTDLFSSFSFGLAVGLKRLRAEFGLKMVESESVLSVSIKHISL